MSTDIGPVIDEAVKTALDAHAADMQTVGNPLLRASIGALVGVPPFSGQNPSSTSPTAGGRYYLLPRFATEPTLSVNATAAGGNASLISLQDED